MRAVPLDGKLRAVPAGQPARDAVPAQGSVAEEQERIPRRVAGAPRGRVVRAGADGERSRQHASVFFLDRQEADAIPVLGQLRDQFSHRTAFNPGCGAEAPGICA